MVFVEAFLWGTGLSLGICVGLVAWVFLRTAANKACGITDQWEQINTESLAALNERNRLTAEANKMIERIAVNAGKIADRE